VTLSEEPTTGSPSVSEGCITKIVVEDDGSQSVFELGPKMSRSFADMLQLGIDPHLDLNVCSNNEHEKARVIAETIEDAAAPEGLTDGVRDVEKLEEGDILELNQLAFQFTVDELDGHSVVFKNGEKVPLETIQRDLDDGRVQLVEEEHDLQVVDTDREPMTDGGRERAFPGDDLWAEYRDAEIGVGDVVVDLTRGAPLQVTSVATKRAGEHPNVRSDRTADMFSVDDDELVFNCVFLPDSDDPISPPSRTYAYPTSRLLRYPVEEATANARLQREWLTNLLEELSVEASKLGGRHHRCFQDLIAEAFSSEVAEITREFAEAAGGESA